MSIQNMDPINEQIVKDVVNISNVEIASPETQRYSQVSAVSSDEKVVIAFGSNDPQCPGNWPKDRKIFATSTGLWLVFNSTLGSSLPSGASSLLATSFQITSQAQLTLPVAVFLIGYVFGPIIFSPLSESYGRKTCLVQSFAVYTVFTFCCALAPTWSALVFFRFMTGGGASGPSTIVGGLLADLYPDLKDRGKAITFLSVAGMIGPLIGPIVAGFVSNIGWRWMFWVALTAASISWPFLLNLPEAYGPIILARRAHLNRSESGNPNVLAPIELERKSLEQVIRVVLARPIRLFAEPIVLCTCAFLALGNAILYLYFEAYPLVFKGIYGMSSGIAALTFIPVGVGTGIALAIFLWYDNFLDEAKRQERQWAIIEEYRRLPLTCIGGPLMAASQFWLAWTSRSEIYWIWPALSGILYGVGMELTYMALSNYLTDVYDIFAASAIASSVFSRSIISASILPLSHSMYEHLGIKWSCSLLGFVCLIMSFVPSLFIKYGAVLRARSPFCQRLHRTGVLCFAVLGTEVYVKRESAPLSEVGLELDHGRELIPLRVKKPD